MNVRTAAKRQGLVLGSDAQLLKTIVRVLRNDGIATDFQHDFSESLLDDGFDGYDWIVLDENCSDSSAFEMLRKLRSAGHQGPIALIVGAGNDFSRRPPDFESGAIDVIAKPFSLSDLRESIGRITKSDDLSKNVPLPTDTHNSSLSNLFLATIAVTALAAAIIATTVLLSR